MINEVVVIKNVANLVDNSFYVEDAIRYVDVRFPSHEFMLMPPTELEKFEGQWNEANNIAVFVYDGTFYMIPFTFDVKEILEEKFIKNDQLYVTFNAFTLPKGAKVRKIWEGIIYDSQQKETAYQQQLKNEASYN